MNNRRLLRSYFFRLPAVAFLCWCGSTHAEQVSATDIVRRSDDLIRRGQSYARVTMEIERPDWNRTLVMEGWSRGTSNSFIRVLEPKKEKDVTFLKNGRQAWQYVPAVDRVIKIPPSMMLQSWMGSDLTNDDIVRADSLVVDYDHTIRETAEKDSAPFWIIEGIPKEDAAVVWGKVVFKIARTNFVADRVEYYDEDGKMIKYYQTYDVKTIEDLDVATRFTMFDLNRPGYSTTIRYDDLTFNPDLKPHTFTQRNLKR